MLLGFSTPMPALISETLHCGKSATFDFFMSLEHDCGENKISLWLLVECKKLIVVRLSDD